MIRSSDDSGIALGSKWHSRPRACAALRPSDRLVRTVHLGLFMKLASTANAARVCAIFVLAQAAAGRGCQWPRTTPARTRRRATAPREPKRLPSTRGRVRRMLDWTRNLPMQRPRRPPKLAAGVPTPAAELTPSTTAATPRSRRVVVAKGPGLLRCVAQTGFSRVPARRLSTMEAFVELVWTVSGTCPRSGG